jgi:sensor histidine kinase YesM
MRTNENKLSGFKNKLDALKYRIPVLLILFSIVGYLIGLFLIYNNPDAGEFNFFNKTIMVHFVFTAIIIGFLCEISLTKLNQLFPWKKSILIRFTVGYFSSLIIAAILIIIAESVYSHENFESQIEFSNEQTQVILKLTIIIAFVVFVFNLLHFSLYSYQNYFINSLKIKRIKREQMELHIEALKNQLTPHYLFNNLNTISSLISSNIDQTEEYIRSFVNSCRFLIDNSRNILISLQQELEFVKSYQLLMEMRFPGMFKIEIKIDESLKNLYLPPLSIQMLVENAIKHNSLKSDELLNIKIYNLAKNYLAIENNISELSEIEGAEAIANKKNFKSNSLKVGLMNIKSRYAYLTDKEIIIEKNRLFSVKLPLINSNNIDYEAKIA